MQQHLVRGVNSPEFPDALGFRLPLSFQLSGRKHLIMRKLDLEIVEHLDVIEYILPGPAPGTRAGAARNTAAKRKTQDVIIRPYSTASEKARTGKAYTVDIPDAIARR